VVLDQLSAGRGLSLSATHLKPPQVGRDAQRVHEWIVARPIAAAAAVRSVRVVPIAASGG
jgi:hypothetical protein